MKAPTQHYLNDLRRYYKMPATQVSLTLVLSLVVMAVFIVFALRPTFLSIVKLRASISEAKSTLALLDTKVANLQTIAIKLDQIKPYLDIINTDIPNKGAAYGPLTTAIELIAQESGTQLDTSSLDATLLFSRVLSPFSPAKGQKIIELPFSVRVTGDYAGVTSFLQTLLAMERIVSVESSVITRESGSATDQSGVSLVVSGQAYYLADETQLEQALKEKGKL